MSLLKQKIEECRDLNPNLNEYTYLLQATAEILKNRVSDITAEELNRDYHTLLSMSQGAEALTEVATNFIGWIQLFGFPTEVERLLTNRTPVFRVYAAISRGMLTGWENSLKAATRDLEIRRNTKDYKAFLKHYAPTACPKMLDEAQLVINDVKSFIEQNVRETKRCIEAANTFMARLNRLIQLIQAFQAETGVSDQGKIKALQTKIDRIQNSVDTTETSLKYYANVTINPEEVLKHSIIGYKRLEDLLGAYYELQESSQPIVN